jgi:hypothetical protein
MEGIIWHTELFNVAGSSITVPEIIKINKTDKRTGTDILILYAGNKINGSEL